MKSGGKEHDPKPRVKINGSVQIRRDLGLGCLMVFIVFLAYLPAIKADFIWDDDQHVGDKSALTGLDGLRRIWFEIGAVNQYYPVTHSAFWLMFRFWGMIPFGYHLVNVALHALSAVLLWMILRRLAIPGAFLAAAVFALHPVHVESVAWVTELKNCLSGFFYIAAFLVYVRYMEKPAGIFYLLAFILYLLALLSKTVTCSLPAAILLVIWYKKGRIAKSDIMPLVPFFLIGLLAGILTPWVEKEHIGASGQEWHYGLWPRFLIMGRAIWFYAAKLLWPHPLIFNYPRWTISILAWGQYVYLLGIVVILILLWLKRRRTGRGPIVAVLFFIGTLFPALGFFNIYPLRYSFVADHFQYLASIGLIVLFASLMEKKILSGNNIIRIFLTTVLLSCAGVKTWYQAHTYLNAEVLFRYTLEKNPSSWLALNSLGLILFNQGKVDESIALYRQSIELKPDDDVAYNGMGAALLKQGKAEDAIKYFQKAVELNPDYDVTLCNLGNTLSHLGRKEEANQYFLKAVVADPDSFAAHYFLGNNYMDLGQNQKALKHYIKAVQLNPGYAKPHQKLGEIYYSLGSYGKSIDHYRRAVKIQPQWLDLKSDLAWVLSSVEDEKFRNGEEAVRLAEEVCQKDEGKNPIYLDILAAAYAAAGRYSEATQTGQKALRIAESKGAQNIAGVIKKHIEAFQQGRPWTQKPKP